jgi:hypothetical protein
MTQNLPILGLNFHITGPVDIEELIAALGSFQRQYTRYMRTTQRTHTGAIPDEDDTRLFIREIKTGSILADLVPWVPMVAPTVFPLLEYHNAFADFISYVRQYMNFLQDKGDPPENSSAAIVSADFADILAPFARRRSGDLQVELKQETPDGMKQQMTINYTHAEATKAHTKATRLSSAKVQASSDYQNVVMHLPRLDVNSHPNSSKQTPDRGIIERVTSKPLRVVWASEHDSIRVKNAPGNPLKNAYIVDVNVENCNGKPVLYNIIRLHEIIEPDQDDDPDLLNH